MHGIGIDIFRSAIVSNKINRYDLKKLSHEIDDITIKLNEFINQSV